MLHEIAAGDLDLTNIVNPIRKLLRHLAFLEGQVQKIDLEARKVVVSHGFDGHAHEIAFDQVVLALGSTTQFFGLSGVEERVKVTEELAVPDWPGVWALGDSAMVPDLSTGKFCPPTAQHALRQGKVTALNIEAYAEGGPFRKFNFKTIGQLATIGHRAGVASAFGVNVSGSLAWWMWRTIYLSKLPRLEKKIRVALDWTLDLLFSEDLCQFVDVRQEHKMNNRNLEQLQEEPHPPPAPEERALAVTTAA